MRKFTLLTTIPVFLLAGLIVACGGDGKKTVDVPGGGEITVSDDLPDNFPDDLPKYDGAKVLGSVTGESEGQEGTLVTFETDDDIDDVEAFYESELEDKGWKSVSTGSFGGAGQFVVTKGDTAASVFISEVNDKVTILITYGSKADLGLDDSSDSGDDSSSDDSGDDSSSDDSGDDSSSDDSSDDSSSDDSGDSGSAELPDEVDLDDEYPKDEIPLPDGARVTSSSSITAGGQRTFYVELYVKKSVDDLETFYKDKLEGAGYENSFSTTSDGELFLSYTSASDASSIAGVTVNIGPSDVEGYSKVSLSITSPDE